MNPGMFLEACINDSEHIAVRCRTRCLNQSNQPALSREGNEALSSWRLVSGGEMKIVSSSNKAKIKNQLQPLQYSFRAYCWWMFSSRYGKDLILALAVFYFYLFFFYLVDCFNIGGGDVYLSVCLSACRRRDSSQIYPAVLPGFLAGSKWKLMVFSSFEPYCLQW